MKTTLSYLTSTFLLLFISALSYGTDISGTVTSDVTLTLADSPYNVTSDYIVPSGFTLTIEPGVEIFLNGTNKDIFIGGTIIAEGTALDSIIFTSSPTTSGGSLVIQAGATGNSLEYCSFSKLGTSTLTAYDTGIQLEDAELSMDHCEFDNCGSSGGTIHIRAHASSVSDFGGNNEIETIQFLANSIATTATWPNADTGGFEYRIAQDQTVPLGETLTIEPGVTVEFSGTGQDLFVDGTLLAIANSTDSITFRGDSGGGSGGSLVINLGSTSSEFQYCSFFNLGTSTLTAYDTGIYLFDAELTLNNCSFDNCGTGGEIHIRANSNAVSDFGPQNSIEIVQLFNNSLDRSTTWPNIDQSGFAFRLIGDQTVPSDDTLNIEPGVEVQLYGTGDDLYVDGTLKAIGNSSDSIFFYGVASNFGGTVSLNYGSEGNVLEYCSFRDLGRSTLSALDCGLWIDSCQVVANHLSFDSCGTGSEISIRANASSISGLGANNNVDIVQFLGSSLNESCTWPDIDADSYSYRMTTDLTMPIGNQLTIEPGVRIDLRGVGDDLRIEGTLDAQGTSNNKIEFFSTGTSGGGSLVLEDGSSSTLEHINFNDLGKSTLTAFDTGIRIFEAEADADFLTFIDCGTSNITSIRAKASRMDGFGPNNSLDDVWLDGGDLSRSTTWKNIDTDGFQFVMSSDITVPEDSILTIDPGVQVWFRGSGVDLQVYGTLIANGLEDERIKLLTYPSVNSGGSVVIRSTSTGSSMSHCLIDSLGRSSLSAFDAGVRVETSDLSLTKSTIRASRYGVYVTAGDPQIEFNIIKDNSLLGLFNANSNDTVTACNNYWGDPTGPFNSNTNPTGLGNGISDKVIAANCTKDALEIVCPDDMAFNVGDDYSTLVAGLVEVCINDCENKTVSFSDDDPDPQCTQDVIRTWTVSDTCGNLKTCDQILSFTDVIAPTIVCAADQVLVCNSPLPPIDTGAHSVSDNCAVDEVTFLGVQEDIVGCIHTYSRTYQVTDLEGNSATCVQEFEVKEDLFAPILSSLPSDFTVDCTDFPAAPTITATDNCDGSLPVTFTEVLVEDQCGILLTRTWSVSDECGNEASHTQNILGDRGVITFVGLPSDLTIECSEAIPSIPTVTAEDNCGAVNITFSETSDYDCSGTILRTWVATDVCGSTAMHTQTITIVDDTAPVLSEYPADEVVACPEDVPSPATLTASDNCAVSLVVDFVETQSGLDVIRTWSTIDDCGNEESHTQTIVVLDDCDVDCSVFDTAPVDLTKSFDPVNGVQDRVQVKWFKASPEVRYSDEDAAACDIKAWPKRNLIPGTSTPTGPAIIAAPEDTIDIVNTKKFQPDGVTPRSIFKWPLKFRADGANNNKRVEPNIRYKWAVRCACEHGEGQESPWSEVKIFNTPDFDPVTGIYTPPSKPFENGNATKSIMELETSIYPNPSTGLIQLAIDADNFSYELIDIGGRVISTESINASRAILDFSYLSEGIYMMRISAKGFYHIERIVIRR